MPLKSPCACRLSRRPPLTQLFALRLGLSQGAALQPEPLAMLRKALPFLRHVLRGTDPLDRRAVGVNPVALLEQLRPEGRETGLSPKYP